MIYFDDYIQLWGHEHVKTPNHEFTLFSTKPKVAPPEISKSQLPGKKIQIPLNFPFWTTVQCPLDAYYYFFSFWEGISTDLASGFCRRQVTVKAENYLSPAKFSSFYPLLRFFPLPHTVSTLFSKITTTLICSPLAR